MPLVQIMGFNCQLYILRHVQGFYVLERVDSITFLTNHHDIKDHAIENLIACLETAKNLCLDLKNAFKSNSLMSITSKMASILINEEQGKETPGIRAMIWANDSEKEEDKDDTDEESDIAEGDDE